MKLSGGLLLWALGTLSGCASLAVAPGSGSSDGASGTWLEIETAHFVIHTDLPELPARNLAQSLEETRAGLLTVSWARAPGPPDPIDVVVFARPTEFQRFRGDSRAAGELVSRERFGRLIVFSPGKQATLSMTAVHELAHELSFWFIPLQPLWFAEGLATFLEALQVDRQAGTARLGEVSRVRAEWLQSVLLSSEKLFATEESTDIDPRQSAVYYSTAWLLVHYLQNKHNAAFGRFQVELAKLNDWRGAWRKELPELTPERLDAGMLAYTKGSKFATWEAPLQMPPFEARVRRLSAAQAHGVLARTAWMMSNQELADQERTAAQQLDPDEVRAAEVEFAGLSDSKDEAARRQLAQRVAKAHPKSATAWLLVAQADASPELRSAALERARRIAPEEPLVHWYSAWAALERGQAEQALAHSHRVLRRWPVTPNVLSLEVRSLAANGGCDIASEIVWAARSTLTGSCSSSVTHEVVPCSRGPETALAEVCPTPAPPPPKPGERHRSLKTGG